MREDNGKLNERKKMILKAIIETHVRDGEPVGSRYLMENQQIALSSATIRNEMAELEEMGYLEQPHTSAGRVPSENGYRFYVDSLMQKYRMSQNELLRMNALAKSRLAEVDKLLESASRLAAALTNYASIALKPKSSGGAVHCFKVVPLDAGLLMLILILTDGETKTLRVHTDFELSGTSAERLEGILNTYLADRPADAITMPLVMEMERAFPEGGSLIGIIIKQVCEEIGTVGEGELRLSGVNHLLEYPEYADTHRLKDLLGVLEDKRDIMKLMTETDERGDSAQVVIGSEIQVEEMKDSALVFKRVMSGGRVVGAIGILGPRRMDYSKVVSTIEYLTENLNEILGASPGYHDLPGTGHNK